MEAAQLQAALDDALSALGSALGRIEAFRIRERQLIAEVSALRQQVHGEQISQNKAAVRAVTEGAPLPASPSLPPPRSPSRELRAMSTCSITIPQQRETFFTSLGNDGPMYVSSVTGAEHAVAVWLPGERGLEKINCQLIVDKDRIDFVQLRVRVRSEDFIGITAVKESKTKSSGGLLCCFGGSDAADVGGPSSDMPANGGGGAQGSEDGAGGATSPEPPAAADGSSPAQTRGRYRIYLRGREQRPVEFDASHVTRATLHKCTQRWLGQEDEPGEVEVQEAAPTQGEVAAPRNLMAGVHTMNFVGERSNLLSADHISALASCVPPLERMRDWGLAYSTKLHGISLSTLYRKVHTGHIPTLTLIKDNAGHIFGCYTPEAWRISPRYYGSGESFVFQLEPYRVMWPWVSISKEKNDFFQYSTPDCLAIGGTGHFALHVDQELLQGSSGTCGTFGSPCLSGHEDFRVLGIEIWQVV